ncbi:MAG: hypothetical protein E6Q97_28920 [Desulfurellales bacterium]|nr:MAG: hypothetical protein E6Q97_28920 [Desulfurellales bacterium]
MDTIEIERLQVIATKMKNELAGDADCNGETEFFTKVIQLGNFAKLQERKLRRARHPMNESLRDELDELANLAKEQQQLIDTAKGEVGTLAVQNVALSHRLTSASMSLEVLIEIVSEDRGIEKMEVVRLVEKRMKGALVRG